MKKIFKFLAFSLIVFIAVSCSQGAAAIDKAYEQACGAAPSEKVAMTLCNGDIKVSTLTSEEYAKLGAVIGYLTYTGMYSANFEAQVDMYEFGKLLREYKEHVQTPDEKLKIEELTKELITNLPASLPQEK